MSDNVKEVGNILLAVVTNSRVKCEYQPCLKQLSGVNAEVRYNIFIWHMFSYTVEPWIASIIRSRNVLVIQNTRISK
jgi:hypothetical protein